MFPLIAAVGALGVAGGALAYRVRPRPMDSAENRRAAARTVSTVPSHEGVKIERSEFVTSQGIKLATIEFIPEGQKSKGIVYVCHGYADYMDLLWFERCIKITRQGFTCVGVDLEAHGRSDGILVFITDFERLVTGAFEYFQKRKTEAYSGQKSFLMGESMGGAVAIWMLILFGQEKEKWDGAVFLAPMCKIADELVPPAPVVKALTALSSVIPTWPIVPSANIVDKSFKDKKYLEVVKSGPFYFGTPPRVATALQMLRATNFIDSQMEKLTVPFLILHGAADTVTDPLMSKTLYERSQSKDKTLKLYPGVWHCVLEDPDSQQAWADMFAWLNDHL